MKLSQPFRVEARKGAVQPDDRNNTACRAVEIFVATI